MTQCDETTNVETSAIDDAEKKFNEEKTRREGTIDTNKAAITRAGKFNDGLKSLLGLNA
jgi:hypothetical protein